MLYLGADHRGFALKEHLKRYLAGVGIAARDLGAATLVPGDDYVDYALAVSQAVAAGPAEHRGLLICGSGVGMDVVANKVRAVRSSLVTNVAQAEAARREDDANVLTLSADATTPEQAVALVDRWLNAAFSGEERHVRRLKKIQALEAQATP